MTVVVDERRRCLPFAEWPLEDRERWAWPVSPGTCSNRTSGTLSGGSQQPAI